MKIQVGKTYTDGKTTRFVSHRYEERDGTVVVGYDDPSSPSGRWYEGIESFRRWAKKEVKHG